MLNGKKFEEVLEQAVRSIREEEVDSAAASQRVLDRLMGTSAEQMVDGQINGCPDIQKLLPAYRAGRLTAGREMLVQDHLRECVACRNEYQSPGLRKGVILPWRDAAATATRQNTAYRKMAIAAALLVGLGTAAYTFRGQFLPAPAGSRATIASMEGPVYIVNANGQTLAHTGQEFGEREWVRTPGGSHAFVKLRDGSMVEMNERSEFGVTMNRMDTTVQLERGAIIVQAAKRRTGHLLVMSDDTRVSVTGTVFSVNRGTKGARVSVMEGEVRVEQYGQSKVLHSGDQTSMNSKVEPVPVSQEIAWSKNLDSHLALLKEFSGLAKQVQDIRLPGMRYGSKLLESLPPETMVYVSIPNMGEALSDTNRMFQSRIRESAVLRDWWQKSGGAKGQPQLDEMVETIRSLSEYLGDEVVLAVTDVQKGSTPNVVLIAEVKKAGLPEFVQSAVQKLGEQARTSIELMNEKSTPAETKSNHLGVYVGGSRIAISPNSRLAAEYGTRTNGGLLQTAFGQRIAESYRDGASILFTANLQGMGVQKLGADQMKFLVVEQRQNRDRMESRATVNFAGQRSGLASWLAAPAPMGSLDFVGPDASVSASFVVKNPAQLLDDIFAIADNVHRNFRSQLRDFEATTGVRIREDIAASLGTDVTIALDGPMLPIPAWKLVVEANDPARLQQSIEKLVSQYTQLSKQEGHQGVAMEKEQQMNRTVYVLKNLDNNFEVRYAFSDGYLIMTPNKNSLRKAFRAKDDNWRLADSGRFRSLLPADRQANFSGVIYYNLGSIAESMSDLSNSANINPQQKADIQALLGNLKPSLIYAYGENDRIQIASTGGFFGLTIEQMLGSGGLQDLVALRNPGTSRMKGSYK